MTKRRRFRGDLFEGMKIKHQYHDRGNEYNWYATVLEIDDTNDLKVLVTGEYGSHPETWNKAHTESALRQFEYLEMK